MWNLPGPGVEPLHSQGSLPYSFLHPLAATILFVLLDSRILWKGWLCLISTNPLPAFSLTFLNFLTHFNSRGLKVLFTSFVFASFINFIFSIDNGVKKFRIFLHYFYSSLPLFISCVLFNFSVYPWANANLFILTTAEFFTWCILEATSYQQVTAF